MKKIKRIITLVLVVAILLVSYAVPVGAYRFDCNGAAKMKTTAFRLPDNRSESIWWVDKNDSLDVIAKEGDFYLVLYPFNNTNRHILGYVPVSTVNVYASVPDAEDIYLNETATIDKTAVLFHMPSTNALYGASGSNQTVRRLLHSCEVNVLFKKDGFYCIQTNQDTGFVTADSLIFESKSEDVGYSDASTAGCRHSSTTKERTSLKRVADGDVESHTVVETYNIMCDNCSKVVDTETKYSKETHFAGEAGCCIYCSEQIRCKHNNTQQSTNSKSVSLNDGKHLTTIETIRYCNNCGTRETVDMKATEQPHNISNGNCASCGYTVSMVERRGWVYNTEGSNLLLRDSAGKTTILRRIPEFAELIVIGDTKTNGYYRVIYDGVEGYAHSDYISFNKVEQPTVNNSSYILPFSGVGRVTVLEWYWGKSSSGAHPTKGAGSVKGAVDFAVTGSALATTSATVIEASYNSGWGNNVTLRHDDGTYSFYAHLSKISVSVNQKVNQGQAIGTIGSTGNSTGVHLHFEIWNNQKQTIYTIDALKDRYKDRLRFDSDVVCGGSNSSSIRNWIVSNYALSNGVYVPKANTTAIASSTTSTSKPATTQQTTQTTTAVTNKKANFVNSNLQAWKGVLDSKFQAANAIYSVVNSVNIRTGIQKVLGTGVVAVYSLSPGTLYRAFDEDVVIGIASFGVTNEYLNRANVAHNSFLSHVNKGINTEEQAQKAFELYRESLACYNAVIDAHYLTVSEYAQGSTYTKKMLNTFFLSVVDAAIPDITKLKKVADATMTTAELLETVESGWSGLKSYKSTISQWDNIWNKL